MVTSNTPAELTTNCSAYRNQSCVGNLVFFSINYVPLIRKNRYSEKTCFNNSGCYGNRHSIAIHNITCNKKNTIFLSLTPYRLMKPYRRFGGLYSLSIHSRMIFYNEDEGRVVRRNVVKFLPDYEASSGTFHIEDPHKLGNTVGTKFSHPGYLESGICSPLAFRSLLQMAA
jgi:hypothetical protein